MYSAALALAVLGVSGCELLTPAPRELTPREALERAADAAEKVTSVHFILDIEGGTMQLGPGLQVSKAEGDVLSPDRANLKFTLRLGNIVAESQLIVVGQEMYLTNPLSGRWERVPGAAQMRILDTERGVPNLLRKVSDPQRVGIETLDGVRTQRIKGSVPGAVIVDMVGGQATTETAAGEVWIGADDFLVRQVRLEGALAAKEKAGVVRTFKLTRFNEPVTIEPPI